MGELADRYAQAFLEAGGDQAQLARSALRSEIARAEDTILYYD